MKSLEILEFERPSACDRIALCRSFNSNFGGVAALLAATVDVPYRFFLSDRRGCGLWPDLTTEQLQQAQVVCLQGDSDQAIGNGERDRGGGYTGPRDRRCAQISDDDIYAHTALAHRAWLQSWPQIIRWHWGDRRLLLGHGSPRQVNECAWESDTTDQGITDCLQETEVDGTLVTHMGRPWLRWGDPVCWCNVGVFGHPAHEGGDWTQLTFPGQAAQPVPQMRPLTHDSQPVVATMTAAGLPAEFQASPLTNVWTTCAENLPDAERSVQSRFLSLSTWIAGTVVTSAILLLVFLFLFSL
ncbi:MAG: hypothetical protein ACFBSG_16365 [Leptolyngbyaceae cyanobacterium]